MFLGKLFSIFKRKKDNQNVPSGSASGGPVVSPSTAVGGAVGLDQPSQPVQPSEPSQPAEPQAEAPSPAPEIAQADTPAPSAPSFDMPSEDSKPAEPDNNPFGQPAEEQQIPEDDGKQSGDDMQDATIGGNSDAGAGTDNPLDQDPVTPSMPSGDSDMGVATPPASDDNNQMPTV